MKLCHSFQDFNKFMIEQGWVNRNRTEKDLSSWDQPSEYPCVVINEYYMDYDNRMRDHLYFVSLSDFNFEDIEKYYKNKINEQLQDLD